MKRKDVFTASGTLYRKVKNLPRFAKLFKVGAANEVAGVYTSHRTHRLASPATRALGIIDGGKIVNNLDCTVGTGLFALAAGYTAVKTNLANLCDLAVAVALYNNARCVVNKMNNAVGAGLYTNTATDTLSRIDFGNILFGDADSVTGTRGNTVAVAKAGEGAEAVAGIAEVCGNAAFRTGVLILFLLRSTRAVAGNVRHLLNDVGSLKSHNLGNALCNAVTAGNAERGVVGFALGKSLCISVTAGEAASAAVCTGKAIADCRSTLILLYPKENGGHGENKRTYNSDNRKNDNGN